MAEETKEPAAKEKKPGIFSRFFPRLRNLAAMKVRSSTGAPLHEIKPVGQPITSLKIYEDLQKVLNYKAIGTLNKEVIDAEQYWEGGVPVAEESSASNVLKEARELYRELGHYYDKSAISKEMTLTQRNPFTDKNSVAINIKGLGVRTFEFSVPKEDDIIFSHGLTYTVGYIGHNNQAYYNTLKREISSFCDGIEKELKSKVSGATKDSVESKLKSIKDQMLDLFAPLQQFLVDFENERRSDLSKLSEAANKSLEGLQKRVKERRLLPAWVVYRHTYRVIKTKITKVIEYPLEEITVNEDLPSLYKIEKAKVDGKDAIVEMNVDVYFNPEINPTQDELDYITSKLRQTNKTGIINAIRSGYDKVKILQEQLLKIDKSIEDRAYPLILGFLRKSVFNISIIGGITKTVTQSEAKEFTEILSQWLIGYLDINEEVFKAERSQLLEDLSKNKLKKFHEKELSKEIDSVVKNLDQNLENIYKDLQRECSELKRNSLEIFSQLSQERGLLEQNKISLHECLRYEIRKKQLEYIFSKVDFKSHLNNFFLRKDRNDPKLDEFDWGLDHNGWPLEVAEEDYIFEVPNEDGTFGHELIDPGTVLLDVFNRKKPYRKVPIGEWTDYCDLLDMATWVYVSYDAYRDDLRDGRYHENSLSIMEYILNMEGITTPYVEFNKNNLDQDIVGDKEENGIKKKVVRDTERTTSILRINGPPYPENAREHEIEIKMKPTHLNPAFDLRRKSPQENSRKDKHLGRKLYYNVQDNVEQSKNPTMTSRGAALYILANVIERVKYWNEAIELLGAIGNDTQGYDIGPNIQGEIKIGKDGKPEASLKRWGISLTKNPFLPIEGAGK